MTAVANKPSEAGSAPQQTGLPRVRVSGVVPAMKAAASLPPLGASTALIGAWTRTPASNATKVVREDDAHEWQAALARAKANEAREQALALERARVAAEEEEWAWREALARAKARAQSDESREWSVHIARARSLPVPRQRAAGPRPSLPPKRASQPQGRLVFWP